MGQDGEKWVSRCHDTFVHKSQAECQDMGSSWGLGQGRLICPRAAFQHPTLTHPPAGIPRPLMILGS